MLVRNKKLPLNLVKEAFTNSTTKGERLLQVETFGDTFGPGSRRKRPALASTSLTEMLTKAEDKFDEYDDVKDGDYHKWDEQGPKLEPQHAVFSKG